jgi:bacterioferritin-associated ferredoxin
VYVCICRAITTETVLELAAQGARRTREVAAACGAGTVCGKCRPTIRRLLLADEPARDQMRTPAE